jgi:hypothetical protein
MLYKFKSKATGDLIMLEPQGRQILGLIGKEPTAQGILQVQDMPAAIEALQAAVVAIETAQAKAVKDAVARGEDPPTHDESVSLRQRATPFLTMMRRCLSESHDIVWGV